MHAILRQYKNIVLAFVCTAGTANAFADPCFTVDGNKVTVDRLFTTGKPHVEDVEDMPSQSSMVSRGSEAHNLIIMKIKRDGAKNVNAFSATIDGKNYEYPKDGCR